MSLLERLRAETRPQHEQTEALFYTQVLQNGTLTVDKYRHLLRTHWQYHQALETAIDRFSDFFRDYAPETRCKTAWLEHDLALLNEPLPQQMAKLFIDWSPVALLGAAYVSEGSMLGGKVIGRLLQKNPLVQSVAAQGRFYGGYGAETGNQWKRFGAFITQQGADYPDEVVAAAKQAFNDYQTVFGQMRWNASDELPLHQV